MESGYDLETDAEGVLHLVPVGAEQLEAAYLAGGADMAAYAGAYVVVADHGDVL